MRGGVGGQPGGNSKTQLFQRSKGNQWLGNRIGDCESRNWYEKKQQFTKHVFVECFLCPMS